jgi:hypothetical protein
MLLLCDFDLADLPVTDDSKPGQIAVVVHYLDAVYRLLTRAAQ